MSFPLIPYKSQPSPSIVPPLLLLIPYSLTKISLSSTSILLSPTAPPPFPPSSSLLSTVSPPNTISLPLTKAPNKPSSGLTILLDYKSGDSVDIDSCSVEELEVLADIGWSVSNNDVVGVSTCWSGDAGSGSQAKSHHAVHYDLIFILWADRIHLLSPTTEYMQSSF